MDFKSQLDQFTLENHNGDQEYLLDGLSGVFQHRFFDNHLFVYRIDDLWMDFSFFERSGAEIVGGKEINRTGELFWYGNGPLGNLKELRHSYFTEYVFYANPKFIKQCCDILLEYFEE